MLHSTILQQELQQSIVNESQNGSITYSQDGIHSITILPFKYTFYYVTSGTRNESQNEPRKKKELPFYFFIKLYLLFIFYNYIYFLLYFLTILL